MARILYFPGCEPGATPAASDPPPRPAPPPEVFNRWEVEQPDLVDLDLTPPAAKVRAAVAAERAALEALPAAEFGAVLGVRPEHLPRPKEVYGDPPQVRPEGWELWMHDPPQHPLQAPSVEEEYERAETLHNLYTAIETLPDGPFSRRFKTVIRHRLGLDGDNHGNPETLDKIGTRIGKTRSTVQQIEEQAERNHLRRTFADLEYGHCPRCGCALYEVRWWGIRPRICPLHGQG